MKAEPAIIGIVLVAFIGYLIGTLLEHPVGAGGLQFFGAVLGVMVAIAVLVLGEALKDKKA